MSEKIFLGIGCGPIQTGIFVAGASKGNFDKIVIAEVNPAMVEAIRKAGSITVNTSNAKGIVSNTYDKVEIYNPSVAEDLEVLKDYASKAIAINTALPATKFYQFCVPWLKEGFKRNPDAQRYVYTSENSTTAADDFKNTMAEDFPNTYYLDTVIGKMSKIFKTDENPALPPLAPGLEAGHLVEEFCTIYTSSAPGIENVGIIGLYPKQDLYPFEEAKLYGHNASHFALGMMAKARKCTYMSEVAAFPEAMQEVKNLLINECGAALCKKYAGLDELFTPAGFAAYADDLLVRMVNIYLQDAIARVIRDLDRKLGWDDRVIGTMRMILSQGCSPEIFAEGAALALKAWKPEADQAQAKEALAALWPAPWGNEHETLWQLIAKNL
jgi:mannitol-1-phosphate 5-dehydrogenase